MARRTSTANLDSSRPPLPSAESERRMSATRHGPRPGSIQPGCGPPDVRLAARRSPPVGGGTESAPIRAATPRATAVGAAPERCTASTGEAPSGGGRWIRSFGRCTRREAVGRVQEGARVHSLSAIPWRLRRRRGAPLSSSRCCAALARLTTVAGSLGAAFSTAGVTSSGYGVDGRSGKSALRMTTLVGRLRRRPVCSWVCASMIRIPSLSRPWGTGGAAGRTRQPDLRSGRTPAGTTGPSPGPEWRERVPAGRVITLSRG